MESRSNRSIVGRINSLTRKLMVVLAIPVALSLIMMLYFSGQYAGSIQRMEKVASLKPVIGEEIPEAVWRVVSGRETMEESGTDDMLAQAKETLDSITAQTGENDRLELTVAGRTLDTLAQYVDRIRENLSNNVPVIENEAVLSEVRGVAALVVSMLNDYITEEIDSSSAMSGNLTRVVTVTACAEALLLIVALIVTQNARKKTERFVREPIEKLERVTSKLADGDMSARLPVTNVDELWNLTGQVNVMADNLEEMMKQNVRDERNLTKAELRTLQAQINPHFLYNTLDAIVWKAEAGDEE
jgi:two-component system sensor histidine kinase YesM